MSIFLGSSPNSHETSLLVLCAKTYFFFFFGFYLLLPLTFSKIYIQPLIASSLLTLPVIDLIHHLYERKPGTVWFFFTCSLFFKWSMVSFSELNFICLTILVLGSGHSWFVLISYSIESTDWLQMKNKIIREDEKKVESFDILRKKVIIWDRGGKDNFRERKENILKKAVNMYIKEMKISTFFPWLLDFVSFNGYPLCSLEYLKVLTVLGKWKKKPFNTYCSFIFRQKSFEAYNFWGLFLFH